MEAPIIRSIQAEDNAIMEQLVRSVLDAMDVPKTGTAYEDESLKALFEAYAMDDAAYFVVQEGDAIVGGAGIYRLPNVESKVCELQKMYFLPGARGKGLGAKMLEHCLDKAITFGYVGCYLETMPYMKAAQELYLKFGFSYVDSPMGCTGHTACPVYMFKEL